MALNIKPNTKYYRILFQNGSKLNFVPMSYEAITTPGDTIIIENSVFFLRTKDENYNCFTGTDNNAGSWKFSKFNEYLYPYYKIGKIGEIDGISVGAYPVYGIICARNFEGEDTYFVGLYQGNIRKEYDFFVEGVSLLDGVTTMAKRISEYPEKAHIGVINTHKFDEGGFADLVYYTPSGLLNSYGGYTYTTELFEKYFDAALVKIPGPNEEGGVSEPGGGGGSFDNTSKPIEIPNLPPISASSTGFISLYNPTLEELNNLSSYLWSDLFEIDGWKKLFANPMDAILGLSILPVSIPSGGTKEVKVGNIGTGISLTVASTQFVEVDCGSLDIKEYWGAYLDYEPYTQAQIFLPYIGTRPISVDEIMGKTLSVKYHIDILSGACCCFVKSGDSVLYTFNGQCSIPIPITGADYNSVVNGILTIASSAASMVATGGQTAPLIAAGAAEGATKTAVARGLSASASFTNSMISGSSGIASSLANQMKPQIAKSGSISGSAGLLNMQTPYLIITRPRQALPLDQNKFIGYPSLVTVQLTELTGYTEIQSIHLENIPATSSELDEIENLLKGGVIF